MLKENKIINALDVEDMKMLNNSSLVIALYNGRGGGTGYTVKKAQSKGLKAIP